MAELVLDYRPRAEQEAIHEALDRTRFAVVAAHRRLGKTTASIAHLIRANFRKKPGAHRYAYLAPTYSQAKRVAWDILKSFSRKIPGTSFNEAELRADYANGGRIYLLGVDRPDSVRGMGLDGTVLDEVGQMPTNAWPEVIRPTLADRMGWSLFIGTPKGPNAFKDLYDGAGDNPDWWRSTYRASETDIIPQRELDSLKREMSDEQYAQEFECSWSSAVMGAYYSKLLDIAAKEDRICRIPIDPRVPIVSGWDLGFADSTAIWFAQMVGREIRVVDYHEDSGEPLPHYARVLADKGYHYGEHLGPHDIEVHEYTTGTNRKDVAASLGLNFRTMPAASKDDQIEAVRNFIPRCVFDEVRCKAGLESLRNFKRDVNHRTGELKPHPCHDWASHGSDAFAVLAMGMQTQRAVRRPTPDTSWIR